MINVTVSSAIAEAARRLTSAEILSAAAQLYEQEGQHPLTGQRAPIISGGT